MTDRETKIAPAVIFTEIQDSAVVLNLNTKRYYILNSTARAIWRGISEGKDESGIVETLALEYDATREHITASVRRAMDVLRKAGLIR